MYIKKVYASLIFLLLLNTLVFCKNNNSKSVSETKNEKAIEIDSLSLLFVGDIMLHSPQINAAKQDNNSYNFNKSFSEIKNYISSADISFAGLETTLGGKPFSGYPMFSSPDELAKAIKEAGFDVLTTANNHCNDRGSKGIIRTLNILDSNKLKSTGTYRDIKDSIDRTPFIIEKNGFKIGILSATYGTNGLKVNKPTIVDMLDLNSIERKVNAIKEKKADYIIALIHWGIEYQKKPNANQKKLAKSLANIGIDAIIGSHPHVVQDSEWIENTNGTKSFCIYSLGNFMSNQNTPVSTRGGMMLSLKLFKSSNKNNIELKPKYQFVWMQKKDKSYRAVYKILDIDIYNDESDNRLNDKEKIELIDFKKYYRNLSFVK